MSRSDKESRDAIQRNLESLSVSFKKKKKGGEINTNQ